MTSIVQAQALEPVILNDKTLTGAPIGLYVEYLRDEKGLLAIDDILRNDRQGTIKWMPSTSKSPSFGYIPDAVWIKFIAKNPDVKEREWYLEVGYSHLDHVDLYIPTGNNKYIVKKEGDYKPFFDVQYFLRY